MATAKANLDRSKYVRINNGLNPMILQANRDQVRVVLSDARPAFDNTAFHQLNGGDAPFFLRSIDTNVWALSITDKASLTVTEFTGINESNPIDTISELSNMLYELLTIIASNQVAQSYELQMLNIRVEEAFETRLDEGYLNDPSN